MFSNYNSKTHVCYKNKQILNRIPKFTYNVGFRQLFVSFNRSTLKTVNFFYSIYMSLSQTVIYQCLR